MRTDAKIGSAILGVLLLVLVIYAVAVPKHKTTALKPTGVTTAGRDADQAPVSIPSDPIPPVQPVVQTPLIVPTPPADPLAGRPTPPPTGGLAGGAPVPDPTLFHPAGPADAAHDPMTLGGSGTAPTPLISEPSHAGSARHGGHPSSPAPALAGGNAKEYTIRANDTLSSISADVYGNAKYWTRIADANKDLNPNRLKVGTVISLPAAPAVDSAVRLASAEVAADPTVANGTSYKVQSGDSLYRISKKLYGTTRRADDIYHLNEKTIGADEARLKVGTVLQLPEPATAARADHMATVAQ